MSTFNLSIASDAWSKIVDKNDTDFLVTWTIPKVVEFASTDLDEIPVVIGHYIPREHTVTRDSVGAGYIWARLVPDGSASSILLTVSKTTSTSGATGGYDMNEGVHKVATMVWNASTLQWERGTGSSDGSGNTSPSLITKRIDVVNTYLIYVGEATIGTSEASSGWNIKKIMFDVSGNPTGILQGSGNWLGRVALTYQ